MNHGPAIVASRIGIAAILLGVLFAALEGNEWMRQLVIEHMTPPDLALPAAECPADELEEEDLSRAECEQLVADVRSYVVSRPDGFATVQAGLAALGTLLALASIFCGAALVAGHAIGLRLGVPIVAALAAVDAGHFVAAQQAGPILRGIHLAPALLWFSIHGALALALYVASTQRPVVGLDAPGPHAYGRFEIATHWFVAIAVFFLFVSSWWMLALPLPSEVFRYRELPFQLHKNLGITIAVLLIAMAVLRIRRRHALASVPAETPLMRQLRLGGHIALYVLILAVCVTGYLSSSYSGWDTAFWWLIELPRWGHENEELNQLYSDLHHWACWGLLLAMTAHIGAALLHALRDDGVVRRILHW